ncbi:MAG: efflux RND transporter permease subunit, partial [Gammaproteobacteria bacterium]
AALIERAVNTLNQRLLEELVVVVLVCALFLYHLRSSMVILVSLPVGILCAFIIMRLQGINANIMSLGGVAIAIGAMVDAAVVMIENVHKHIERSTRDGRSRLQAIQDATLEVGSPLFFSLLIIMLSFLPILALEGQEAKLFAPLAYTKTYAMAAAAGLSITLVPALMAYFIKGSLQRETDNPLNRGLIFVYRPLIEAVLRRPGLTFAVVGLLLVSALWPLSRLGSEFMPEMDEGDLLYMPTTLPAISIGKARELLQQTDRLIKTIPEVERVFGKAGRAETATDPAPLTMIETLVKLKPKDQWRSGMTLASLKQELDRRLQIPSLRNAWLMPIRARIDMQSTGINTPVGIKITGPDIDRIQQVGQQIETVLSSVAGTKTVYSERSAGARYIDIDIDRYATAHYGLSIAEVEEAANIAIGGVDVTYTVEGRERYPVNLRYPRELRDSITKLKELPIVATEDTFIQLQDIAEVRLVNGPPVIKSENARINGWVYITTDGRDIGTYVKDAKAALQKLQLPPGYTLTWAGQYADMERMQDRMSYIVPIALLVIAVMLYLSFQGFMETLMIMFAIPLALVGGVWLLWLLDFHLSVASAVGFIALAGVATEFGVVMLIYLRDAVRSESPITEAELRTAVIKGAAQRVRPKAMTAAVIIVGLLPILMGAGAGSEAMQRIAAPMIGGMITAPLVSMLLLPLVYFLWCKKRLPMINKKDYL